MRVAVVSDIHSNLHALEAVLAAVDADAADELWCLGDVVGYGPRPNRCCTTIAARARSCLAGNHDLAALGALPVEAFAGDAGVAIRWTAGVLDADAKDFLTSLAPQLLRPGVELYHGSPRDPVWDYVLSENAAAESFALTSAPLVLVGHSHVPLALTLDDGRVAGGVAPDGTELDLRGRWLLNPGSVGQPRDGDPRAAWLLLDLEARRASFRRTWYPLERTQAEIADSGLPSSLARRLAAGQ